MNPETTPIKLSPSPRTPKEIIERYIELGFKLVFWPRDLGKGPSDAKWQQKANNGEYTADQYHEGMNVGALLGVEISPGRFLVDIDFDWPIQPQLGEVLLPNTHLEFGRSSKLCSHLFYTTSTRLVSKAYKDPFLSTRADPDRKSGSAKAPANIVEFRSSNEDGSLGHQTVLPPSVHPSGETILLDRQHLLWEPHGAIAHDDDNILPHRVALYTAAYLLYERFSSGTFHHPVRMAAAGFFLSCGLSDADVYLLNEALSHACNNDRKDARSSVTSTIKNFKKGRVTGRTTLAGFIGKEGNKVLLEITKILGGSMFVVDAKDRISNQSQENIRVALDLMGIVLSYNEFSRQYLFKTDSDLKSGSTNKPLLDQNINHLWLEVDNTFHFRAAKEFFQSVIIDIAHGNSFHPVKDYLASLTWDGIPRLDDWIIKCGGAADNEYTRAITSIWMIATVRRIVQPGCKFDETLVLEGEQGKQKSSAIRLLCPFEEWYGDDLPLDADGKVVIEKTLGKWIVECADLVGMRSTRVEQTKAMLSRGTDNARMSYDRMTSERKREFTTIATTNSHVYLKDSTGNRRFWPVRVNQFDLELIQSIRDQLWAEAVVREKNGESIRLSPHLYPIAAFQQERRREEDPWEETLREHFRKNYKVRTSKHGSVKEEKRYRITLNELWNLMNVPIERRSMQDQSRINVIMTRAGFRKGIVLALTGYNHEGVAEFAEIGSKGWLLDKKDSKGIEKIETWLRTDAQDPDLDEFRLTGSESEPDLEPVDDD